MAVDMFLDIAGVEGEAQDHKYGGKIAVLSWSWGESNAGSGGFGTGQGAGKVNIQDMSFTMRHSKASPVLFQACASGKHFDKAELTCRKAGEKPVEYLKITFTDVMISSYQTGASGGGDDYPIESVSFNFTKVELAYIPQKKDGTPDNPVKGSWNVKTNQKD